MKKSKCATLILSAAIVISLMACGSSTSSESSTASSAAETSVESSAISSESSEAESSSETSSSSGTRTVTSYDGTVIEVPENVERIASIYGPAYERIAMLGAEDKIVVQAGFTPDNYPWCDLVFPLARSIPKVQGNDDLNVEEILSYSPDVVFNFDHTKSTEAMREAGLPVLQNTSLPEFSMIKDSLTSYAEIIGTDEAMSVAKDYASYFDDVVERVSAVTDTIPESERKSVYLAMRTITGSIDSSSPDVEMIEIAGGKCVTADLTDASTISPEQIVAWDPDIIILDHVLTQTQTTPGDPWEQQMEEINSNEQLSVVKAVKNGEVYCTPTGAFFWDMGVQRPLMVMWLAKLMYPDKFEDIDLAEEVQYFYSEFYHYDMDKDEATALLNREDPPETEGSDSAASESSTAS